jgi:starvation-inducible DNA-binding protein
MEKLQELARKAFASEYGFLLMSACYHWNVKGPHFFEYHDLFGKIYNEVDLKIDVFAEQLRGIQTYTPASFTELQALSDVVLDPHSDTEHTTEQMIHNLYLANGIIATDLLNAYLEAEKAQEFGLSNFLSERMEQHRKHGWMLYATMKAV